MSNLVIFFALIALQQLNVFAQDASQIESTVPVINVHFLPYKAKQKIDSDSVGLLNVEILDNLGVFIEQLVIVMSSPAFL